MYLLCALFVFSGLCNSTSLNLTLQFLQELEKEKAARLDLERTARVHSAAASDQTSIRQSSAFENGNGL